MSPKIKLKNKRIINTVQNIRKHRKRMKELRKINNINMDFSETMARYAVTNRIKGV